MIHPADKAYFDSVNDSLIVDEVEESVLQILEDDGRLNQDEMDAVSELIRSALNRRERELQAGIDEYEAAQTDTEGEKQG